MQLQDIENEILDRTQQSELVNFGGPPHWDQSTNPLLSRELIDYRINRAYIQALRDVAELELAGWAVTFKSVAGVESYPLPPPVLPGGAPNPPVHLVTRVFYQPVGYTRALEFEPGVRFIPWQEFQRKTRAGYLRQVGGAAIPSYVTVAPDRTQLVFFLGPAGANDLITVVYSPVPTAGSLVPLLVAEGDVPILPDECNELLVLGAMPAIWERLREFGAAKDARMQYDDGNGHGELPRLRERCLKRSKGDKLRITLAADDLATSMPWPFPVGL